LKLSATLVDHLGGEVRTSKGADISLQRMVEGSLKSWVVGLQDVSG